MPMKTTIKRVLSLLLCVLLAASLCAPVFATNAKTVRVGWYDSSYNTMDETGRRYGYAYDYQQKIAAYTGWEYEYVDGSWSELLEMLENGEIDLMSDVSYKPDRAEKMLYPTLPMGAEEYYIFVSSKNTEITALDVSTLNGKRVGVNKSSIQADFYMQWAEQNGVNAEVVLVNSTEKETLAMLDTGELDAYVTVDAFAEKATAVPVCKVGASDYYFVVTKSRPDLLTELESALSRIQDENRYYHQQLFDKYVRRAGANAFLSAQELEWLTMHGPIRIGYQDNYMAFCAKDEETGELKGVLKRYLEYAETCMANAEMVFEPVAYPTAAAALEALQNGEVCAVFPANFSAYDSEMLGVITTPPMTQTEVFAIVRPTGTDVLTRESVTVAVNEQNPNYDLFLDEHYSQWERVYCPTTNDCLKAVASGKADCVLLSNYRYNNIARLCEQYHLVSISTGVDIDYCFAVAKGSTEMYSILTKVVGQVPQATVNTRLAQYISEEAKTTLADFVHDHAGAILIVALVVAASIFLLLMQNMRAVNRAKRVIAATEVDELTRLYNRAFFFHYADALQRENPNDPMDAIVLNIEHFHSVNALNGREFGDLCLCTLAAEIAEIAKENSGIAGRFGADRFDIYCKHTDNYSAIFNRLQSKLDELSSNTTILLRMGVMPWQGSMQPIEQFDHARVACSMARGHYHDRLIIFDDEVREREKHEQRLQSDLRSALEHGEIVVYYQPKYDIRCEPAKLISAEALVRWDHPELGMIRPDEFVPVLERSGQVTELDHYVWKEAARQVARWSDKYGKIVPVSVNLSRIDAVDPTLEAKLEELLTQYSLPNTALKLEITESAYTENAELMIPVVEKLREKGFEIEMDDFGTGYSSLNMLSNMPLDVLKMDRAFVQNMFRDRKGRTLVEMILGISKNLGVPVVAEGVETLQQLEMLKENGCEFVQGYYFSRPLPAGEFEMKFLA